MAAGGRRARTDEPPDAAEPVGEEDEREDEARHEDHVRRRELRHLTHELADAQRLEHIDYYRASGLISEDAYNALCEPLVQHGVRANRETLEAATLYSFEQGLTPRQVKLEEVFAHNTLDQ